MSIFVLRQNKEIKGKEQRLEWITDVVDYFTGKSIEEISKNKTDEVFNSHKLKEDAQPILEKLIEAYHSIELNDETFNNFRNDVEIYFKERSTDGRTDVESIGSIGNLALLDNHTNRSYKNAMFAIKRKRIIENDSVGKFVPICTKNVFLKYYSRQLDDLMYWSEADAEAYEDAIKETLKDYLPRNQQ